MEPINWKTASYGGRAYRYECEKGKALFIEHIGQAPKKLVKRLEREWKGLNPARSLDAAP